MMSSAQDIAAPTTAAAHSRREAQLCATYSKPENILYSAVDDGIALMDIESGQYFHFDAVAGDIWERIDGKTTASGIIANLQSAFTVKAQQCQRDTLNFLSELLSLRLLSEASGLMPSGAPELTHDNQTDILDAYISTASDNN